MRLSKDFTLEEFTRSITAVNHGIDNMPSAVHIANMRNLARNILQPARDELGMPIYVSSGYRCEALNAMIGGAFNSQHKSGEAADLQCADNARLFNYIRFNHLFDQLIWEFGDDDSPQWVHVSLKMAGAQNRNMVLKAVKEDGKTKYINITGDNGQC